MRCAKPHPCWTGRWPVVEPLERRLVFAAPVLAEATIGPPLEVAAGASAAANIAFLAREMDRFNDRFPVYDDVSAAGNHFFALAKIPDGDAPATVNGSWTDNPHSGATCIRAEFRRVRRQPFGGFLFLNGLLTGSDTVPTFNFGTQPEAGIDLSGAPQLTFWARGETGREVIEFNMGGVGYRNGRGRRTGKFPDSTRAVRGHVRLSTEWRKYTIPLQRRKLHYVLNGFGWAASARFNRRGAVFYLDDIQYELSPEAAQSRLDLPRFVRSYTTQDRQESPAPVGDFDLRFRNAAFTYDNALALLGFLADGTPEGLRRARLIGDAFVYAANHDPVFNDGRLRSVYSAGDIALPPGWEPNGLKATVPAPGFYDESAQAFKSLWYQGDDLGAFDTGNNAWAMIALLALYRRTGNVGYLDEARRLGVFINKFRNDAGTYQGFLGGYQSPLPDSPQARAYASTEHNLDVFSAFTTMQAVTGESAWGEGAEHARRFVESMWDPEINCFRTGTIDPETRNTIANQLPLDVQAWSVLAMPDVLARHPEVLACAELNHRVTVDGFTGFDFNNDRDGVWFEGTAQMAIAYAAAGREDSAVEVRGELRRAQSADPDGIGLALPAASHDGVSTGFSFFYFRRLHIGATSWNVFAQRGFNPFTEFGP
jgi:hypothetical protein